MTPITPDQFETFEALILGEQIGAAEASALLADNPDFNTWYRSRADQRARLASEAPGR